MLSELPERRSVRLISHKARLLAPMADYLSRITAITKCNFYKRIPAQGHSAFLSDWRAMVAYCFGRVVLGATTLIGIDDYNMKQF